MVADLDGVFVIQLAMLVELLDQPDDNVGRRLLGRTCKNTPSVDAIIRFFADSRTLGLFEQSTGASSLFPTHQDCRKARCLGHGSTNREEAPVLMLLDRYANLR